MQCRRSNSNEDIDARGFLSRATRHATLDSVLRSHLLSRTPFLLYNTITSLGSASRYHAIRYTYTVEECQDRKISGNDCARCLKQA